MQARLKQVQSFQTVRLNGSASSNPSGFTPLTYNWTQTSGPTVSLSDQTSATPTFVAPQVTTNTDITFQLIVTNSKNVQSSPSFVTITVEPQVNGNGGSSIGGHGGSGDSAISHSGNANGGLGGNGCPDFNGGQNTGNNGGAGGNGGSCRHNGFTSSSAGSGGHGGSAGFGSMPMFSMIR